MSLGRQDRPRETAFPAKQGASSSAQSPLHPHNTTAMAARTVYEGVAEGAEIKGDLFAGKKFWVAHRIPRRTEFVNDIRNNGGLIVPLEKQADYLIADHARRDCPPGSISWRFIEQSMKDGELADPDDYPAGPAPGTVREAGSIARPAKSTRAAYTPEEDRILYKWVQDHKTAGMGKGAASGNELYKQLEAKVGFFQHSLNTLH